MSWIELDHAALYLTELAQTPIGREEILRLALEGHLTLSVRFLSAVAAHRGKAEPLTEAHVEQIPNLDGDGFFTFVRGTVLSPTREVVIYEDRITSIADVWDLPMIGGERLTVENLYEQSRWREAPEIFNMEGTFVTDSNGTYCKLVERFDREPKSARGPYDPNDYFPSAALPDECVLVLRPQNLREFAAKLARPTKAPAAPVAARPLGNRERATLLTVVAALSQMARLDVSKCSAAAAAIEQQTALMGARVAARTIEEHLKRIPEALESKAV